MGRLSPSGSRGFTGYFKVPRIRPDISKDPKQKYKLLYDDVRGDVLRPPHSTTPAAVK